jgi:hypothetical protein
LEVELPDTGTDCELASPHREFAGSDGQFAGTNCEFACTYCEFAATVDLAPGRSNLTQVKVRPIVVSA